ncbi:sensor histidine kinase [Haliscomenobacter sp.]|uniref:sensor histidine kinase n=1 Tax=Haliscomenobacter sp. TaxID=2717303 RepID=UPI003BA9793A
MTPKKGRKLSNRELFGFDDRWAIVIVVPILGAIMPFLLFKDYVYTTFQEFSVNWAMSCTYTISYWMAVRTVIARKRIRYPHPSQIGKRIGFSILLIGGSYIILNFLLDIVHHWVMAHMDHAEPSELTTNLISIFLIALFWSIYESIYMYHRWKDSLNEAERLKREFVQAQLDGLKSQVNPHFLFNSLNTLVYIIPEDPDKAVEFVQKLAKVYRYILEIQERRLIPLWEEMEFLESFWFLHKERFCNNLRISIDIPKAERKHLIVPLSLQLLFENAIKHNIISKEKPLSISLKIEDGKRLVVRNTLQLRSNPEPGTQTGLANIKNRYEYFSDQPVVVEQTDQEFVVSLPLIQEAIIATA